MSKIAQIMAVELSVPPGTTILVEDSLLPHDSLLAFKAVWPLTSSEIGAISIPFVRDYPLV